MRNLFLLLFQIVLSFPASAFPELIRYGYSSCSSCHVSPSGGGVLTDYGKGITEEISGQSYKGEGEVLHGLVKTPDQTLNIGGDVRWLSYQANANRRSFLMQADLEAATTVGKILTVDASVGMYGKMSDLMSRRHFVSLSLGADDGRSLRFGKFLPAYGIHHADHTVATRQGLGLGEGGETYNIEFSYIGSWGEVFVTNVIGKNFSLNGDKSGYSLYTKSEYGGTARASIYLGERSQLGLSFLSMEYLKDSRTAFGPYFIWGVSEWFYLLGEIDYQVQRTGKLIKEKELIYYAKAGIETLKGLVLFVDHGQSYKSTTRVGVQWFPRPHYEVLASIGAEVKNKGQASELATLLIHYYF